MIRLIIFDVDGTLLKSQTLEVLPGVHDFFRLALYGDCADAPFLAAATNQGGVGLRYWMEKDHFGTPQHYPTESRVAERLQQMVNLLGGDGKISLYVSYAYHNRQGIWSPTPVGKEKAPQWQPEWRKPGPGMLRQAMQDLKVSAAETLYVGDRDDDRGAARAAGCGFCDAKDFFGRNWTHCATLSALVHDSHPAGEG